MNNKLSLRTLGDVEQHVKFLGKNCYDDYIPVKDLKFENLETVKIGKEKHKLMHMAQQGIAFRLGIPLSYLRKCSEELQAYNMNYMIKFEKNQELYFRFNSENSIRTVFSPKYKKLDNIQVIRNLYSMGFDKKTEVRLNIDDNFMALTLFDEDKGFKINGNEMRKASVFTNSETGLASFTLSALIYTLRCANGLISKKNLSLASFRHVSDKTLAKIPALLEEASRELTVQKKHFELSTKSHVNDPSATIQSFNKQFQINAVEREAVDWAWPKEEGDSLFHIINTYTKAAQFESLSAAESYKLQKTGGQILSLVQ